MKVGLFAPFITSEAGGVWQFYQWIVARLGAEIPMHLAVPQEMLDEIAITRGFPSAISATSTERALAPTRGSFRYRVLEAPSRGQVLGFRVPLYNKATARLRQMIFGASLESVALAG